MSDQLSREILGCLLIRPGLFERTDLSEADFPPGRLRQTFTEVRRIWQESRATEIDPVILAEHLGGADTRAFVGSLMDGSVRVDTPVFNARVRESRQQAISARIRSKLQEQDALSCVDIAPIRPDLEALDKLSSIDNQADNFLISFPELRALDISVSWTVNQLLPAESVTILYGRTTVGKTWLGLMITEAVSAGLPLFGLMTYQRQVVYVDLENPLANMKERADQLLMRSMSAQLWHSTASRRPPKLDGPDWHLYKTLPSGALLIFDTGRAAHDQKENDSESAALVIGRCKELRDLGFSILILGHTPKANDRDLKSSGAWADLADHTLQFYKVKGIGQEEDEGGEIPPGSLLCLSTGKKTRFAPVDPIFLTLTPDGLIRADDPATEDLDALAIYISGEGAGRNESQLIAWAKAAGIGRKGKSAVINMLARGVREGRWRFERGVKNAKQYYPFSLS
jgi:hypothetical protein